MPSHGLPPLTDAGVMARFKERIDRLERRQPAVGSSLLGVSVFNLAFPSPLSDGTDVYASSISLGDHSGDANVTTNGTTLTYNAVSGSRSLYVASFYCNIRPSPAVSTTDVHEVHYLDPFMLNNATFLATISASDVQMVAQNISGYGVNGPLRPALHVTCTGGTARSYSVLSASLTVMRFAAP